MGNELNIAISVDTSQLGTLADASEQVANELRSMTEMFRAAGLTADETGWRLQSFGYSAKEVAESLNQNAAGATRMASAHRVAGAEIAGMSGSVAKAREEFGAMEGSVNMVGASLARLAGNSSALSQFVNFAFPVFAVVGVIEILGELDSKLVEVSDAAMGYTRAIKEMEKENIKWSQEAEVSASTVGEAHRKLADIVQEQGNIAKMSFDEKWVQAMKDATHATSAFGAGLADPLIGFTALFTANESAQNRFAELAKQEHELTKSAFELGGAETKMSESLLAAKEAAEKSGLEGDRTGQLRLELGLLSQKAELEKQIAAQQEAAKFHVAPEEVGAAVKQSDANIDQQTAYKRIELMNELAAAEAEQSVKAKNEHDLLAESARHVVDAMEAMFDAEVRIDNEENEMFARSRERDVAAAIKAEEKKLEAGVKYAEDYRKIVEDSSLREISAEEAAVTGTANLEKAKLASMMTSEFARIQIIEQIDQKELAAKEQLENEKLAAQMKSLEAQRAMVLGGQTEEQFKAANVNDPEQLAKLLQANASIEAAQKAHDAKMAELAHQQVLTAQQAANQMSEAYMKAFTPINSAFNTFMGHILSGNTTVAVAFQRMGQDIIKSTTESLAQMALKWAEHFLIVNVLEKNALVQRIVTTASGNAEKLAADKTAAEAEVMIEAGQAFAGAYASVMAALPFPVNVATAPAVAAEAAAAVMTGGSFAEGGIVPFDAAIYAHAGEMVLPKHISEGVQDMVESGKTGAGTAPNINVNWNALDSKSLSDFLHQPGVRSQFTKLMRNAVRNGARLR